MMPLNRLAHSFMPSNKRICNYLMLCCFWTLFPINAQAEDKKWYQVEMIIFANLAGRWQDSEKWRDEFNLIYPKDLAVLRPFREYEFEEFDTDFEHLRKEYNPDQPQTSAGANETDALANDASPATLEDSIDPAQAPIASESELAALLEEELLEEQLSENSSNGEMTEPGTTETGFETFPELSIIAATTNISPATPSEIKPMDLDKDPYLLLPEEELQLLDSARRIRNAFDKRVISHIGWRQPAEERNNAVPVLIQGGDQFGLDFELEGVAQLSENRFVHVDVNLFLSQFQRSLLNRSSNWQEFGRNQGIERSGSSNEYGLSDLSNLFEDDSSEFERIFTVNSSSTRRVRSGEVHYIDHPLIGVIVQVSPYTLPDPVMEMRDFNIDAIPPKKPVPFFISPTAPAEGVTAN